MKEKICVGVIGSGIISNIYLKNMTTRFPTGSFPWNPGVSVPLSLMADKKVPRRQTT